MSTKLEDIEVELLDLYDKNHKLTGNWHVRGEKVL